MQRRLQNESHKWLYVLCQQTRKIVATNNWCITLKIRFLGGCTEVGRSAVAIQTETANLLLDYGVLMSSQIGFPMHVSPKDVNAILLSHAHLDHSGATPIFYVKGKTPMYGMEPTFAQTDLLIRDMIKISGYFLPFEYLDLRSMNDYFINIPLRNQFKIEGANITLLNAGHIPGSCQILIEEEGKRVLYTGDFNTQNTQLLDGADTDYGDLDAIVIESTYAEEDHPPREAIEQDFISKVRAVVEDGGTVLVPAFGVGRSQEIITLLEAHHFEHPVFVDGMALKANEIMLNHSTCLRDPELFKRAIRKAQWINEWHDRRRAIETPSVIVSPAGMLKGGAAIFYMENVSGNRKNAVFLVSFQIPGTPGRTLLEEHKFMVHGKMKKVEAQIDKFDFSSHCGKSQLRETLYKMNKKTKVFVMHGSEENCRSLSAWGKQEAGLQTTAPAPGDTFAV